jgi:hypothetical protein
VKKTFEEFPAGTTSFEVVADVSGVVSRLNIPTPTPCHLCCVTHGHESIRAATIPATADSASTVSTFWVVLGAMIREISSADAA